MKWYQQSGLVVNHGASRVSVLYHKKEAAEATSKHYLSLRLLQPLKVELDRETINITVSFSILRLSC
nr:MAG TPA: hypothetical protein [Caudoviricetes sp.]